MQCYVKNQPGASAAEPLWTDGRYFATLRRHVGRTAKADQFDGLGRPSYMARSRENGAMHISTQSEVYQKPRFRLVLALLLAGWGLAMTAGCAVEDQKPRTVTEFLKLPRVGETQE